MGPVATFLENNLNTIVHIQGCSLVSHRLAWLAGQVGENLIHGTGEWLLVCVHVRMYTLYKFELHMFTFDT